MTSELKALSRNTDVLLAENEKLIHANKDLLDRIAILESALKSEKTLSAAVTRQHEADTALIKRKDEELKTLLASNENLQKKADGLTEITSTYTALKERDWSIHHQYDFGSLDQFTIDILKEEIIEEYGKTAHVGMKIPVYLQVLTDKIEALCLPK